MRVSAVIPNWNGLRLLEILLKDIAAQTEPFAEVVVVDNGSTDGSAEFAARSGARVIRFDSNRGFAAAVNRGVSEAKSEIAAILNNDVRLSPEWLSRISEPLRTSGTAYATGKILSAADPTRIDGTFDSVCRGGTAWRCGQGRPDGPIWNSPRTICFPPFTAMVVRRLFYLEMGGLDERFGSYLEDVDFGLTCASKGHTGRYVPDAVAIHAGSATWGRWDARTVRHISRNQILLVARHYSTPALIRFGWAIAVAQCLWGLVALRHGAGLAWITGKIDGLRLWTSLRRDDSPEIASVLGSSENLIRELQRQTGYDWYWRLYFALT